MLKVGDLKSIHVIMVAIMAFVLYSLMSSYSSDGFSVSSQSEPECIAKLEKLEEICCQNKKNCPNGHPIKCDKSCEDHIQKILTSCSNSSDIDKIKTDLSLSCKGEPCKSSENIGGYEFCGEEAKKCMCDPTTKDNKNICRNLVGNKHFYNNDNCAQCKSIIPYWENKLEYCNYKQFWCGTAPFCNGECPAKCDIVSSSSVAPKENECWTGQKIQCRCPSNYTTASCP